MSSHDSILILGGGLGGLTTALALAQRGIASRVLEGAPEFGAIGYGIQFGPNVFHVLDRIGLTDAMRNCVSNIHASGLSYDEAAFKVAWLVREGLARGATGVELKDESGGQPGARIAGDVEPA